MGGILHASARLLSPSLPAFLIAALLSGCLYYHRWTRPGATEQDFYQDSMRCHRETAPRWAFCWGAACDAQASARKDVHERERWRVSSRRHAYAVVAGDAQPLEAGVALCSPTTCSPGRPTPRRR